MIIPLPITYNSYVPDIMLVDRAIRNLKQAYSEEDIVAAFTQGYSIDDSLNVHVSNLILTYGPVVKEYMETVYAAA